MEKELNRERLIKALECMACGNIPSADCGEDAIKYTEREIAKDTLAFIKQITEENETLKACNERQKTTIKAYHIGETVAATVREMQDALEHRIHSKLSYHGWYLKETVIAEIAKEVLGGANV